MVWVKSRKAMKVKRERWKYIAAVDIQAIIITADDAYFLIRCMSRTRAYSRCHLNLNWAKWFFFCSLESAVSSILLPSVVLEWIMLYSQMRKPCQTRTRQNKKLHFKLTEVFALRHVWRFFTDVQAPLSVIYSHSIVLSTSIIITSCATHEKEE